jgi:hypothetical protein
MVVKLSQSNNRKQNSTNTHTKAFINTHSPIAAPPGHNLDGIEHPYREKINEGEHSTILSKRACFRETVESGTALLTPVVHVPIKALFWKASIVHGCHC